MKYAAAAGVLALAGSALANTNEVVQTFPFDGTQFTDTFSFQRAGEFSGLQLKSVTVDIEINVSGGSLALDNDGETDASTDVTFLALASTSSALMIPALNPQVSFNAMNVMLGPDDEHPGGDPIFSDEPGDADFVEFDPVFNDEDDDDTFDAGLGDAALALFEGLGMYDIDVTVEQFLSPPTNGAVAGGFTSASITGSLTVTYQFLPAPGAGATLALAGLAAARRRRSA